jgi:hypothetical protein
VTDPRVKYLRKSEATDDCQRISLVRIESEERDMKDNDAKELECVGRFVEAPDSFFDFEVNSFHLLSICLTYNIHTY